LFPGYRAYLDTWSNVSQPPAVSIRNIDGTLRQWVVRNALDASHPYGPYLANHSTDEFGTLTASDGQTLHYRLIKPDHMVPARRYPVVIDVYGGPGNQYVTNSWGGMQGYFRQMLAQRGYVVFSLDNRGS